MTSRTFVVNAPRRRSRTSGEFEPQYDLTPASEFGPLIEIFTEPNPIPKLATFKALKLALDDYGPEDRIMLIGHPVLLAWAVALISTKHPKLKTLNWVGALERYVEETAFLSRSDMTLEIFAQRIDALAVESGATSKGVPYCDPEEWAEAYADGLLPEDAWANELEEIRGAA